MSQQVEGEATGALFPKVLSHCDSVTKWQLCASALSQELRAFCLLQKPALRHNIM